MSTAHKIGLQIMRFHRSIHQNNQRLRQQIVSVLEAALTAVDPITCVTSALRIDGETMHIGGRQYNLGDFRRILVIGAGKAGAPMASAVEGALGDRVDGGLVVVKSGHSGPTRHIDIVEASHPVPDEDGVLAGKRVLKLAENAGANDMIIALLSGGGSALLVAPAEGITLSDIQEMTGALLACGATINEINCLRKHCSAVKGGQLARAAYPATLISLALSDVVGSPLDVIASGPTVPDASTWRQAWEIVERYELADRLPRRILERLQAGLAGKIPDTPKPDDPAFEKAETVVVGDNFVAAMAASEQARALGFNTLLLSTYVEGEAAQVAKLAVALAKEISASSHPVAPPACLILGGETTVQLGDDPGSGGRNQELALSAALELDGTTGITIVSLATDGTDGPTDSAGGMADGGTVARGRILGLDAADFLRSHDAYPYLKATNDLLVTGPTQTNVNDLIFVFVES
jgi:glycerate 2-kinase